jgi:hypothetical protein
MTGQYDRICLCRQGVSCRPDGYRVILNAEDNQGLKATTAMKRDIEKLTGENSVEILF